MSIENLKEMKHSLINCVQGQMGDLKNTDAHELGEAIDMIKDLSEAIYYCTVTEAMEKKGEEKDNYPVNNINYYTAPMKPYNEVRNYDGSWYTEPMYTIPSSNENQKIIRYIGPDTYGNIGDNRYYNNNASLPNDTRMVNTGRSYYEDERDIRNMGMSPSSRRMYIEAKDMNKGNAVQMQELEHYMKDLSKDITDMIQDSSPEEKLLLQQKLLALANKIKPNTNVSN